MSNSDIDEDTFADHLESTLRSASWTDIVDREVYLPIGDNGRYLDLYVTVGYLDFAIEIEDTRSDALYNGVAQSQLYANFLNAIPMVVYPAEDGGITEELRLQSLQTLIIPVPSDWDGTLDGLFSYQYDE